MAGGANVSAYVSVIFVLTFFATVHLVRKYAEKDFPKVTYITCVAGYFCTFGLLLLVPIDLAATIIDRRNNDNDAYKRDRDNIVDVYNAVFIPILILANVVLVFEEYYNTDGYFTVGTRWISAFKRMMLDIIFGVIAGVIILIVLITSNVTGSSASSLQLAAVIVTNTVYEGALMFLLAYGLVAFPRMLWNSADLDYSLLAAQMNAASEFKKLSESSLDVSLVVSDVMKTKKQVESYGEKGLNDCFKVLLDDAPEGFTSSTMGKVAVDKNGRVTVDTLANLRTRLNVAKDRYRMAQGRVEEVKFAAYQLEDIAAARNRTDGQELIFWTLFNKESTRNEYLWHVKYRPMLHKAGAIMTAMISVFMCLGVFGSIHGVDGDISVYYQIIQSNSASAGGIVIFVLFTLGYTAYITLWSLLQVKLAGLMELVEGSTTPESMSFNVRMVMRLTPPLAFFYLGWLSENGVNQDGSFLSSENGLFYMPIGFTKIYEIGKVKVLRQAFSTVFPVMLFCLLAVFGLNLWNRLAVLCKIPNYQFGAEIVTEDVLREGKRQLQRYRKHMERKCQRKEFKGKLNSAGASKDEGTSILGSFMNLFSAKGGNGEEVRVMVNPIDNDEESGLNAELVVPSPLTGVLERKAEKKMMGGGGWKQCYCAVVVPGELHFYKDAIAMNNNAVNSDLTSNNSGVVFEPVSLALAMSFKIVDKNKNKGSGYVNIDFGDNVVSLKFKTSSEAAKWKEGLLAWKEYAIDYQSLHGGSLAAGFASPSGQGAARSALSDHQALNQMKITEDSSVSYASKHDDALASIMSGLGDEKPAPLSGWLEKKSPKKVMGSDWQKRYCVLDEATHSLKYYKKEGPNEKESGSIDLLMVADILPYDKNSESNNSSAVTQTDLCRFNVDMGEGFKNFKFKAKTPGEAERWISQLSEWREYCLMNMSNV